MTTTTTFFTGSTPSGANDKRSASASSPVNKALAGAQAAFQAPSADVSAVAAYPWMTPAILAGMSPRAHRLLHADH